MTLVLITGASSGLGKALAIALAGQGLSLILSGRNLDALTQLSQELPVPTHLHCGDLTNPEALDELIALIHHLTPDLVINNAGIGYYGEATAHPTQESLEVIDLNIRALTAISLESAKALKKKAIPGTILNISSAAAFFPFPSFNVYAASKAYVNAFSCALDSELSKQGIRVLTVCPGQIATPFRTRAARGNPQQEDPWTIPVQSAVQYILEQIQDKKTLHIIDRRYRMALFFARHFLPRQWVLRFLEKSIHTRLPMV
jgi:hypothetical protein